MPKNKKLFIFDLDGTLIHFPINYILNHAKSISCEFKHPEISHQDLEESFSSFTFFDFVPSIDREIYEKTFWDKFSWSNFSENKSINGARETLEILRNNEKKTAIATARYCCPNQLNKELSKNSFIDFIDLITTKVDESSSFKDKSIQLNKIISHFNIHPKDAVMIGDIPPDISCAKEFGIGTTIAVLSGGIKRNILEKENPDYIFNDISEILKFF